MVITIVLCFIVLVLFLIFFASSENKAPERARGPIIKKLKLGRIDQLAQTPDSTGELNPDHDDKWQHWTIGAKVRSGNFKVRVLGIYTTPRLHFWVKTTVNHRPLTVFPHIGHYHGHIHQPIEQKKIYD